MILTSLRLNYPFFKKYKLNCRISSKMLKKKLWKPKNCSKIAKKSLFFPLFGKKSFLNQTLGIRKSFLNQTTYVLKNRLYQQTFLNRDSNVLWKLKNQRYWLKTGKIKQLLSKLIRLSRKHYILCANLADSAPAVRSGVQ